MKNEGNGNNVIYPPKFFEDRGIPKPEKPKTEPDLLSEEKRREIKNTLEDFINAFNLSVHLTVEKLKIKSKNPQSVKWGKEFKEEFEGFRQFKQEWENRLAEIVVQIKNKDNIDDIRKQLGEYFKNLELKCEGILATEEEVIKGMEEFSKKWGQKT